MEKSSYFPSPLRKDYTSKPVRNFQPIIVKKAQKPISRAQPVPQQQKTIKYLDGLLVNIEKNQNRQSGLFFTKNNLCFLFNLEDSKPHGENYVIYLSGVILSVTYAHGIIHRWLVAVLDGKFITAQHYRKGIREGFQYFYDVQEKLMVISEYQRGKLVQIRNGVVGDFNKIMNNEQVTQKVEKLKKKNLMFDYKFPNFHIGDIRYFGELKENQQNPNGYGVLFDQKQIFIGHFNNGFLNGVGGIKFGNDDFYYGQFSNGVCSGYGCINSGDCASYKFENEEISKLEFQKYLQIQFKPGVGEYWLQKYKDLDIFHQQYRKSFKTLQEEKQRQQDFQALEGSEINLEIQDSISKRQQLIFEEDDSKIKSPIKKSQMIPKLSLFQQMKIKEKTKLSAEDRSARINQDPKQIETDRNRTQTERNEREQRINPNKVKNQTSRARHVKIQNKKQKFQQRSFNQREEKPQIQEVGLDKWYVSAEHNFMKPNQLQPKAKIDRTLRPNLQRSNRSNNLNMGKLMKVGSDVSDKREDNFLNNVFSPQQ